ncbi:MAG: hypothetical protein IPI01_08145 [Ignavibacteriae bacterium]|nr:hypothetical protein [Ignavibacteriota bacterium]
MRSTGLPQLIAVTMLTLWSYAAFAERLPIRTYTASDGLGSAFVAHVMQDRAGFLWFSTRDGLSRYNGYEFVTFGAEDGLSSGTALLSLEAPSGRLFVITNGGLIASNQASGASDHAPRFAPFLIHDANPQPNVQALALGPTGILWGGGTGNVVRDLDGNPSVIQLDTSRGPAHPVLRVSGLGKTDTADYGSLPIADSTSQNPAGPSGITPCMKGAAAIFCPPGDRWHGQDMDRPPLRGADRPRSRQHGCSSLPARDGCGHLPA